MGLRGCNRAASSAADTSHSARTASTSRAIRAKGLSGRRLRLRISLYRSIAPGVTGQQKTAKPLHRKDSSFMEQQSRLPNRGKRLCLHKCAIRYRATRGHEAKGGSARGTSIGLSVKPPVTRIRVLGLAGIAHFELRHGRRRAIVGYVLNDRVTGTTVSAVGEGISVAAIQRIPKVAPALVTSASIAERPKRILRPCAGCGESKRRYRPESPSQRSIPLSSPPIGEDQISASPEIF